MKREEKKRKLKLKKQRQKENTRKNKENKKCDLDLENNMIIEKIDSEENLFQNVNSEFVKEKNYDINNMSKLDGIKAYTLISLKEIINEISNNRFVDNNILMCAKNLFKLALNPEKEYINFIINNFKRKKYKNKYGSLNKTERHVLKSEMLTIINEFTELNKNAVIDYGAIGVCFQLSYQTILDGLQEKKIKSMDMYVGYKDTLINYEVIYTDEKADYNFKDLYNLSYENFYYSNWNSLNQMYNIYCIYKNQLSNFGEDSLKLLANAYEMEDILNKKTEGIDLISYNGVVQQYCNVFEKELRELIKMIYKKVTSKTDLFKVINLLEGLGLEYLSDKNSIENLHKVRKIRNKVAHGVLVDKNELQFVKQILFSENVLSAINTYININTHMLDKYYIDLSDSVDFEL